MSKSGKVCIILAASKAIHAVSNFLGEHKVKVDSKGRIKLPAALKSQMNPEANGKFVVNRGFEGCLELYPLDVWIRYRKLLQKKVNKLSQN